MKFFWDNIYLTKDERTQLITLAVIFLLLILSKFYVVFFYEPPSVLVDSHILDSIELVKINNQTKQYQPSKPYKKTYQTDGKTEKTEQKRKNKPTKVEHQLFRFNPNTISRDSLKLLGVSSYAINSLLKYRSKGGVIRSVEQMSKVNGLEEKMLDKLVPYIVLPKREKNVYAVNEKHSTKRDSSFVKTKYKKYKKKEPKIFDINSGDTTDYRNLYGIGKVYSNRIINFRESLGGFFTVDQIRDVWGIEDSLYQVIKPYLKVDPSSIKKRNINNMDKDSLNKHPYINWYKSKAILAYRRSHGNYKSMDDFYKLHALEDKFVDTMKYYFTVE